MPSITPRGCLSRAFVVCVNLIMVSLMAGPVIGQSIAVTPAQELAFIDGGLPDTAVLVSGLRPGVEPVLLDPRRDALAQITQVLATRREVHALHLVGHGAPGVLTFGSSRVTADTLRDSASMLKAWRVALAANADVLIYGCATGQGQAGRDLVAAMGNGLCANVAASSGPVGTTAQGGSWALDIRRGPANTPVAFTAEGQASYRFLFLTYDWTTVASADNWDGPTTSLTYGDLTITATDTDSRYPMPSISIGGGTLSWSGAGWSNSQAPVLLTIAKTDGSAFSLSGTMTIYYTTYAPHTDVPNPAYETSTTTIKGYNGSTLTGTISQSIRGVGSFTVDFSSATGFTGITSIVYSNGSQAVWLGSSVISSGNTAPTFVQSGAGTLNVSQNATATDLKSLLHVSDSDSSQTETWTQSSGPSHGTLTVTGVTASSGSSDITPGGTITYQPTAGFAGTDSFSIQVSDGASSATRTINVNITPTAPSTPDLATANDSGASNTDNVTSATSLSFTGGTGVAAGSTVKVFLDLNGNGIYNAGTDPIATDTADGSGNWSVSGLNVSGAADGAYEVYAFATSATGSLTGPLSSALSVTLDRTVPTIAIGSPSASVTTGGPVTYTVTYADTRFSASTLSTSDITLNGTGTASATIGVTGSGTTRTVTLSSIVGSGTLGITIASGTASDTAGNLAPASSASTTFTVDNTPPTSSSVGVPTNGTYIAGHNLDFTVNFSEAVFVTGTPTIALTLGSSSVSANYVLGSGTTALTFRYTIQSGDQDSDGLTVGGLSLNGGTLNDAAGNNATLTLNGAGSTSSVLVDAVAPSVSGGTVPASTTYAAGQNLDLLVNYSEAVTVTGTPYIGVTLDTGGTVHAAYLAGSGTTTLTFRYTVATDSVDATGIVVASSITLNGGALKDTAGNNAATGVTFGSTAGVLVDGVAPTIVSITRVGTTPTNAATVDFNVTFSKAVTGVDSSDFALTATGTTAGTIASAAAVNASTYTVTVGSLSGTGTLRLDLKSSGTGIADTPGNAIATGFASGQVYTIDHTPPTSASVAGPTNGTYIAGQNLDFTVNFSEAVVVTGTPTIALTLGSSPVSADYLSGSGTTALTFRYTVQTGDQDTDGIAVGALSLNGGTINDAAGNSATLTLNSIGSTSGVLVDAIAPSLGAVTVPANATYAAGQNLDFTVTYSEPVTVSGAPYIGLTLDTGSAVRAAYLAGSGTTTLTFRYTVVVGNADADGVVVAAAITLNGGTIKDSAGNNAATSVAFAGTTGVLVDAVLPVVSSVDRQTPSSSATNAASVTYRVTFSKAVSGVDATDFAVTATGTAAGTITSVSAVNGATYDVTLNTISGDGTLRLDLKNTGTVIADTAGNAIIAGFTAGQVYTIDHTLPAVTSIVRQGPTAVNSSATSVTYRVTFAEGVTGVDATDFILTVVAGTPSGTIGTVTPVSTAVYDVTVDAIAGQGQLRLDLRASGTGIVDLAGNGIGGGFTSGDFYFVGVSNVFDAISLNSSTTRHVSNATTDLVAQRFTTAASAPLSLTTITAALGTITGSPVPVVTIRADNSGTPGATVITTLTNPASLTANALNVWSSNALLAANTTYWVVFADSSAAGAYEIKETAATTGGTGAWLTNSDYGYFYGANAATGPQGGALQLAVGATSTPTITSMLVTGGTYGAAFSGYTITATNLPTSFGATGLPTGLSLNAATGVISGTPTQSGTFNVALAGTNGSGTGASSTLVLTIGKATVTVSGIRVVSKEYDRTTTATLNLTGAVFGGVILGDTLTIDGSGSTATFADRLVGAGKAVSVSGLTLGGSAAGNYTLTQPTGLTGTITAKPLTVTGLGVSTKSYDGMTTASLVTTGYAFSGVILGDTVTLVSANAVATFADSAAGTGKTVSVAGLSLTGADASNYTLTQPTLTGNIAAALATFTLTNLSQAYDGKLKAVGVSFVGPSPTYAVTYNGSSTAPTNAGSYAVIASVTDTNFIGTAYGTLVIAKAPQTIAFDAPSGAAIGATATLSATASSGLAVTFSVVSGNATLSGNKVTFNAVGAVTLRASQAGNDNYAAASVDVIISNVSKLAQAIAFGPLVDQASNGGPFVLNATASSGLPVTFAVVSGPALINGSTVTMTGATGTVIIRASQSGDARYAAAADVTQTFTVTAAVTRVYFGKVLTTNATIGDIAASLPTGTATGSIIVVAGGSAGIPMINTTLGFTLNSDGTFNNTLTVNTSSVDGPLLNADSTPRVAAAQQTLTLHGSLSNGILQGTIEPLGITFSANVLPTTGASAPAAGFYQSSVLANAGATYSIVGTNNEILVLAQTTTISTGGLTSLSSTGTFSLSTTTAAGAATIAGAVDKPATTVSGTVTVGTTTTTYAGLSATTERTDRLINLSSRNRTGTTDSRLIAGFVVAGPTAKTVLIRGAGPALNSFNVSGTSVNPILRLYKDGALNAENDDWSKATNASDIAAAAVRVGAFPFASGSKDAAILTTLAPGAYTAQVVDETGEGVGLAEVYDASVNPQGEYQRLVNISTRGNSGGGDNVLIGGFVVTGNSPKKLLIRGIGPGLAQFGLTGTIADPQLKVYSDKGVLLAQNDNWEAVLAIDSSQVLASGAEVAAAAKASGAFALTSGSKDASLVTTFAPGAYTVHVSGVSGTSGIALVEIYEVSN